MKRSKKNAAAEAAEAAREIATSIQRNFGTQSKYKITSTSRIKARKQTTKKRYLTALAAATATPIAVRQLNNHSQQQ